MAKAGRPSVYSAEAAEKIADRLARGESLAKICEDEDMPSLRSVVRWGKENEDFGAIYAHAREAQAEEMDRKILTTADEATNDNAAAARVKIEAYKWRAARLNPKRYGERVDLTSGGEPIKLDDTAIAVRAAALVQKALGRADAEPE
jgi:hypothetical protein